MKFFSLKIYIVCLSLLVSLVVAGFLSCSGPGVGVYQPGGSTERRASRTGGSSDDEDEGEESVAECDSNTCEDTCREIYEESWSRCNDESEDMVARLQWVFNRLNSAGLSKRELEKISDDDDTVDDFKAYLEIGVDGWIEEITSGGPSGMDGSRKIGYSMSEARETIEWLVENKNVSEVLNTLDEGATILKDLIEKAIKNDGCPPEKVCLFNTSYYPAVISEISGKRSTPKVFRDFLITVDKINPHRGAIKEHIIIRPGSEGGVDIKFRGASVVDNDSGCLKGVIRWCQSASACEDSIANCVPKKGGGGTCSGTTACTSSTDIDPAGSYTIDFDSQGDRDLYRCMSAANAYDDGEDIFTAAADEDNSHLFDLAFSLLDDICENLDSGGTEESTACRKSLMCILAMHQQYTKSNDAVRDKNDGISDIKRWDGWDMISELDLENKLGDDFDECTKEAFEEDNLD